MLYKKVIFVSVAIAMFYLTCTTMQASELLTEHKVKISDSENFSEFYLVLKPSSLGGIGVFAAYDIPAGTLLFTKIYNIRIVKIKDIPQEFIKYCIFASDEECICPEQFDRMEIGWYINHSANPNINYNCKICTIYKTMQEQLHAINDIKAGDEILIDYNYLGEPEHLRESYYRRS